MFEFSSFGIYNDVYTNNKVRTMISKVFKSGNSQALRIPSAFRLNTDTVDIQQLSNGQLLITPVEHGANSLDKGQRIMAILQQFSDDFAEAVEQSLDKSPSQEREEL